MVKIIERDVTKAELKIMHDDFDVHQLFFDIPLVQQKRYGFVAEDKENFIGISSGLTHHLWFYLSDLWLEKSYRGRGIGKKLLLQLEDRVVAEGIRHIYTWTASYEAAPFYQKCGYQIFCEQENYFPNGHGRFGLRKNL